MNQKMNSVLRNSRAKEHGIYFLIGPPAVRWKWRGFNISILTPVKFSIMKGGGKRGAITIMTGALGFSCWARSGSC